MAHAEDHASHELGHIIPLRIYCYVLGALVVLTAVTVAVAQFDFGNWNLVVAMAVASVKATLVALFFMHLKYENPATWTYAIIPFIFLLVLLGGVFMDNPFRLVP